MEVGQIKQLEMVDDLRRLGLAYRFKETTKILLDNIVSSYCMNDKNLNVKNVHSDSAALASRLLLRQQGYSVPQGKEIRIYMSSR